MAAAGLGVSPCCSEVKKRLLKSEQGRSALRQAIKVLEETVERLQNEKNELGKAFEDERTRINLEREAADKELTNKGELEREICHLKEKILALQKVDRSNQGEDTSSKLASRILELEEQVKSLKENLEQERHRGDAASKKVDAAKKQADIEKKKAEEAKKQANAEKIRADQEKTQADLERKKAEEHRRFAEAVKNDIEKERAMVVEERAKVEEASKRATVEKKRADKEKQRADSEMKVSQELKKCLEAEKKKSVDEKIRVEDMCKMLEDERQRSEKLDKNLQDALSVKKENKQCGQCVAREDTSVISSDHKTKKSPKEKFLKEKLKLKMQQLEQVERAVKEEKTQKNLMQLEISLLKQDAIQFSRRLDILEKHCTCDVDNMKSSVSKGDVLADQASIDLKRKASTKRSFNPYNQNDMECKEGHFRTLECLSCQGPLIEYNGVCQPISRGSCTGVLSGTSSQLESPVGVSVRNRSQSSAIYSTTSSFSDRQLIGSQGKDVLSVATSAELGKASLVQESFVDKVSMENCQGSLTGYCNTGASPDEEDAIQVMMASSGLVPDAEVETRAADELKGCTDVLRSIEYLCSKNLKNNLKIEEMFRALQSKISLKEDVQGPHSLSGRKFKLGKRKHHAHKSPGKHGRDYMISKKRKISTAENVFTGPQSFDQVKADVLGVRIESKDTRSSSFHDRIGYPVDTIVFNGKDKILRESLEDHTPRLKDMIGGNVLKLLEMDSSVDEEQYRMALEEPLSPSLPELVLYGSEETDESVYLMEKSCLNQVIATMADISVPSQAFDVICTETEQMNTKSSGYSGQSNKLVPQSFRSNKDPSLTCQRLMGSELVSVPPMPETNRSPVVGTICNTKTSDLKFGEVQLHGTRLYGSREQELSTLPSFICSGHDRTEENTLTVPEDVDTGEIGLFFTKCVEVAQACSSIREICSMEIGKSKMLNKIGQDMEQISRRRDSGSLSVSASGGEVDAAADVDEDISLDGFLSSMEAMETSMIHILESGDMLESPTPSRIPLDDFHEEKSPRNLENTHRNPLKYLVVFPDIEDEDAILKMYCTFEAFMSQRTHDPKEVCIVEELVIFLSTRLDLLNKEWACVFFSLLLYNFSITIPVKSRNDSKTDTMLYLNSFIDQLKKVLIVGEKGCQIELLLVLIERFLIDGRVLLFADTPCELQVGHSNIKALTFDGREILMFSQIAAIDFLAAGSTILACICSAVDQISFLLRVSYHMLRLCKKSSFWILTVVHSFYSVCGEQYFMQSDCSLVASVIQSVVSFLEGGDKPRDGFSSLHGLLVTNHDWRFPSCAQCPFAKGAISMDKAIEVLLKEIQDHVPHLRVHESVKLLEHRTNPCSSCIQHMGHQSDHSMGSASCKLVDAFSLVELLAFYMGWDWTYNNVVGALWKLLEISVADEKFAAILILIGQLGRLGIDASGYEEQGVEKLRCNLSEILHQTGICLLVQLAAVVAILNLLSIEFVECIQKDISTDSCQLNHVEIIKKWFSELSADCQSKALCLLMG